MADISRITLPSGTTYEIKDTVAREMASGVIHLVPGENTTPLIDGADTNPITIDGESYTAVSGDAVFYENKEYVYDGKIWHEFGDLTGLKALAYKDTASTTYTPQGTVSTPSFTGSDATVSVKGTPSGSIEIESGDGTVNYTPEGTVSTPTFTGNALSSTGKFTPEGTVSTPTFTGDSLSSTGKFTPVGSVSTPTISVKTAGATTTVNSITSVGTLPTLTTTVENENLTISFNQGTLPIKGENTIVKISDAEYESSKPTFTGTEGNVNVSGTPTGLISQPTFTGSEGDLSVSGTPTGTISQPTFTGEGTALTASFTGNELTSSGSYTPEGNISTPTFSGTQATITVS